MCVGVGGGDMHNPTTDIMEEVYMYGGLHSPLPQLHVAARDQFQFCAKYI